MKVIKLLNRMKTQVPLTPELEFSTLMLLSEPIIQIQDTECTLKCTLNTQSTNRRGSHARHYRGNRSGF